MFIIRFCKGVVLISWIIYLYVYFGFFFFVLIVTSFVFSFFDWLFRRLRRIFLGRWAEGGIIGRCFIGISFFLLFVFQRLQGSVIVLGYEFVAVSRQFVSGLSFLFFFIRGMVSKLEVMNIFGGRRKIFLGFVREFRQWRVFKV